MTTTRPLVVGPDRAGVCLLVEGALARRITAEQALTYAAVAEVLDATAATIEAGRVNAHTHIYSGLAPLGMPSPTPTPTNFVEILERVWWRLDRALDAESLRASARLYVANALLAGTTTLIDHHESPEFIEGSLGVLAEACDTLGIRALLCYGATDRNGGPEEGRRGIAECTRFLRDTSHPRLRGAIALHASFTVSEETIRVAAEACAEHSAIMHVHAAEDAAHGADGVDAKQRGYDGPLERLLALDALPPGSILAHGLDLTEAQVQRFEATGGWIVQNPRSNQGNEVGYPRALAGCSRVALGTDGYPAVMEDEAAALLELGRLHGEPDDVLQRRIAAGHRLVAERFGGLFAVPEGSETAHADLRVVGSKGEVRHVLVAGEVVVRDGQLLTGDLEEIRSDAQAQADGLWSRMRQL